MKATMAPVFLPFVGGLGGSVANSNMYIIQMIIKYCMYALALE